jgi:hypothetical protein
MRNYSCIHNQLFQIIIYSVFLNIFSEVEFLISIDIQKTKPSL